MKCNTILKNPFSVFCIVILILSFLDYNDGTRSEGDAGNDIVVGIKDTGVGIDLEVLPRLFTKFTTKSETGGTGLGLFISKSIVEAHGGKIWAENNSDGKGSGFYISLPLYK
jgi:signal transduction histidine kinase